MNNMFNLFVFMLICYGLSNMMIYGTGPFNVFEKWRSFTEHVSQPLNKLFTCMMCLPFWIGAILSVIDIFLLTTTVFTPMNIIIPLTEMRLLTYVFIPLLDGFISSGATWLIHNIEEFFERR